MSPLSIFCIMLCLAKQRKEGKNLQENAATTAAEIDEEKGRCKGPLSCFEFANDSTVTWLLISLRILVYGVEVLEKMLMTNARFGNSTFALFAADGKNIWTLVDHKHEREMPLLKCRSNGGGTYSGMEQRRKKEEQQGGEKMGAILQNDSRWWWSWCVPALCRRGCCCFLTSRSAMPTAMDSDRNFNGFIVLI